MRIVIVVVALAAAVALGSCADRSATAPTRAPALAVVPADATPVPLKFHADCGSFTITLPDPAKP